MHLLAEELKQQELKSHLGTQATVLWEQQINSDPGQWVGYTPHYHKITSTNPAIVAAEISNVSIDSISADGSMLMNKSIRPEFAIADIEQHVRRS